MKKTSLFSFSLFGIALAALVVLSCKKGSDEDLTAAEEQQASAVSLESEAEASIIFNDVFDNVMGTSAEVGLGGTGVFGRTAAAGSATEAQAVAGCQTVNITRLNAPQPFPVRIEVDFGAGCTGRDGHTRSGKMITEYTGRLVVPGRSATTTFVNYKSDSTTVEGTYKITNTGSSSERQFTLEATDAKLTRPSGNWSRWTNKQVLTQIEGLGTPEQPIDDVFSITTAGSGEVKSGNIITAWKSRTLEPLIKRFTCRWISKGKMQVVRKNLSFEGQWARTLDYGSGTCDNKAIFTFNGQEFQISLR